MSDGFLSSLARVRAALHAAGHPDTIASFPDGTKMAADAAAAIGCTVAQIAKSIVLRTGERAVIAICSGVNRVDPGKVAEIVGAPVTRADAGFVRDATGFAIGGVAPIGHLRGAEGDAIVLFDRDLLALDPIWAAAGTPSHVFRTEPALLARLSGATIADVRAER